MVMMAGERVTGHAFFLRRLVDPPCLKIYFAGWESASSIEAFVAATVLTVRATSRSSQRIPRPVIDCRRCARRRPPITSESSRVRAQAFRTWRMVPPPARGEVVRQIGAALRARKADLGLLVTLETGKIRTEGEGEVQEMIDMCDFAVGLSRQLYGLTIASERPRHRMIEQWQPLGPIGIITAFNFPVAVWAWNAMIAAVCGDTMIWKPSPLTPLTAIAVHDIVRDVARANGCQGVFNLCIGGADDIGERMTQDHRLPLISATGSCRMGRRVGEVVGRRLGRALLELGGNNAIIITPSAELELAIRATAFAAVGTAGRARARPPAD